MMQGIVIKTDKDTTMVSQDMTALSLLAKQGNVEIMVQTIKQGAVMWLTPGQDPETMEFFYILEGNLDLQNENEVNHLGPGDSFCVIGLKRQVLLKSDTALRFLYITSKPLYEETDNFNDELNELVEQINAKDFYTKEHSKRVMQISVKISEKLNLIDNTINDIAVASLFHDVGKCFVPDAILKKQSRLDQDEYLYIRKHPINSRRLLEKKFGPRIAGIAEMHHERLDGSGYPYNLTAEDIPMEARIIAVADSFDAMTSHRVYNKPKSYMEALEDLESNYDVYDFDAVNALRKLIVDDKMRW